MGGIRPARTAATTSDPVKRIARRCGFGSEETMRRSFFRQMAIAPHDYRMRFSSLSSVRKPRFSVPAPA